LSRESNSTHLATIRFGLAVGARKMIDSEYDHAADSLTSGLYVCIYTYRLLIGTDRRSPSALGWENTPSVFADISCPIITKPISAKNSILLVKSVHANAFSLCPQGPKSVECIG
jgi:hypothetical protein